MRGAARAGRAAPAWLGAALLAGCTSASAGAGAATPAGAPTADPPAVASASPAPAPTASAPASTAGARVAACVAALPLDVRIGQTMLVTTDNLPRIRPWLEQGVIAGVLATGRLTPDAAGAFAAATSALRYGALLAADEEGGPVQRYQDVVGTMPSAHRQAATMTPEQIRDSWAQHARLLGLWGVDLVLAPVVDVGHGPGIGWRSASADPAVVAGYGTAVAQGIRDAGLLPVLKHFPGHGRATGDSHDGLVAGPPIEALRAVDLVPFAAVLGALEPEPAGVLVGHTTIPGLVDQPASQAPEAIEGLLREELGFTGLVISDALGMAASGQPDQGSALVGFLRAGGDLGILGPGGSVEGRAAVRAALVEGTLDAARVDEAAARVLVAKGMDPCAIVPGPAPRVGQDTGPSDAPVVNPTEVP
ncbi:MAG: hypothetical protein MUD13_09850 [Candidatus Nanopelagicales bacterium]|nr:hypothetical protein [Candidatus Nanopelagicales bacterium]